MHLQDKQSQNKKAKAKTLWVDLTAFHSLDSLYQCEFVFSIKFKASWLKTTIHFITTPDLSLGPIVSKYTKGQLWQQLHISEIVNYYCFKHLLLVVNIIFLFVAFLIQVKCV